MRTIFPFLLLLILILGNGNNEFEITSYSRPISKIMDKAPEFYVLEWKKGTRLTLQRTDLFIELDSIGKQEIIALLNKANEPVLYTSNVVTPVCADGECKLMNIKLYWTLLGEYAGFDRYSEFPLTKHDHNEFTLDDYKKLHELLIDDKSILGKRSIDSLVEKPMMRNVNGTDAISGATIAQVKESVVSGALYSCYAAWYLVHGKIRQKLKSNTLSVLNENILIDMLYSRNPEYQIFVLDKIEQAKYVEHYEQIAQVFKTSIPLVRSIIAKSFMTTFQETPDLQKPFWEAFDTIDVGSRSSLMLHLDKAPLYAIEILSNKLGIMSKNQLKIFLNQLAKSGEIGPKVQSKLEAFANDEHKSNAYLVKNYLEEQSSYK